jgi:hypothetical protein
MTRYALLACALLTGCAYTELHEVLLRSAPPANKDPEVLMAGQPVTRPFYEIAILQVFVHENEPPLGDIVAPLAARARQLGCDAIVEVRMDQGFATSHATGVCVKYAESPPVNRPANGSPGGD